MRPLWVVGDVHGAHDKLRTLLIVAGLTDRYGQWTGGDAHLVFLGDYLDRGPDGIGVIRLVQQLQLMAAQAGGEVSALLGNHEVMLLAAVRFQENDPRDQLGFYEYWAGNGGQATDLERLEASDLAWLAERPATLRVGDWLLLHADSLFYLQLGRTLGEINARARALLNSSDPGEWGAFANAFVDRLNYAGAAGEAQARLLLSTVGGERIVHGHTPVHLLLAENGQDLRATAAAPVVYAGGLCLDVDSGMAYFSDAGFIARLGSDGVEEVAALPEGLFGRPLHSS